MYRIFKEALTNVVRHANASEISVDLNFTDRNLRLVVSDNGTGRLPRRKGAFSGLGLIGMQERALTVGLQANIIGTARGTRVVVEGPCDAS